MNISIPFLHSYETEGGTLINYVALKRLLIFRFVSEMKIALFGGFLEKNSNKMSLILFVIKNYQNAIPGDSTFQLNRAAHYYFHPVSKFNRQIYIADLYSIETYSRHKTNINLTSPKYFELGSRAERITDPSKLPEKRNRIYRESELRSWGMRCRVQVYSMRRGLIVGRKLSFR